MFEFDENGNLIQPQAAGTQAPAQAEAIPEVQPLVPAPEQAPAVAEGGISLGTPRDPVESEGERPGIATEAFRAVVGGVRDGVQELGNTVQWASSEYIGRPIVENLLGGQDLIYTDNGWEWMTHEEAASRDDIAWDTTQPLLGDGGMLSLPDVAENETAVGSMARGVAQFVGGYRVISSGLSGVRAIREGGAVARGLGIGAATDFAAFGAHEDRLADLLQDHFEMQNVVVDWLASDEDDTVLEGRLNNMVEGAALGVAMEGVTALVSLFRHARRVQAEEGDEAAATAMNDGLAELAETRPELLDVNRPAGAAAEEVIEGTAREVPEAAPVRAAADEAAEAPVVDTDAFLRGVDDLMHTRSGTGGGGFARNPDEPVVGNLMNFARMDVDQGVLDVWNAATDSVVSRGIQSTTTFGEIAADASRWTADYLEVSPEIIQQSLGRMAQDASRQQGLIVAGKEIALSLSREIERLAYNIHAGTASAAEQAAFLRRSEELVELTANLKSVVRGAAQTTAAGRMATRDAVTGEALGTATLGRRLDEVVGDGRGIKDLADAITAARRAGAGPAATRKMVEQGTRSLAGRSMEAFNEVFINSILSGPKTHMINVISNTINAAWLPGERMIGATLRGDMATARESLRMYSGLAMAFNDSVKAMRMTLRSGDNILDPQGNILEANGSNYNVIRSESENPLVRNVINGLGTVIRIPSRLLSTGDEFFKQMSYRSSLYSRLMGEAYDQVQSGALKRGQVAEWVQSRMASGFDSRGRGVSDPDLQYAREATFTQDLRQGSLPQMVQSATNRFPPMKLVLPFVRTPTNILKAAFQRTPGLHRVSQQMREDLASGDPRRVAAANGKLITGSLLWGAGTTLAMSGTITGSGPADPNVRQRLLETGWRPYSFRNEREDGTVEYVEYRRLEPFAMIFGTIADIVDISGEVDQMQGEELVAAGMVALANNVASKTFLQGITDAIEAFNDPRRHAGSFLRNYAGSAMPYSAAMRELRRTQDPVVRDVRTYLDAVRNNIPGYSDRVPARHSWVTGQPFVYPSGYGSEIAGPVGEALASINPVIAGTEEPDVVLRELAALNHGFTAPPRQIQGVDLTPEQYSRFLQLHGTVRMSGRRNLYQSLERLMQSDRYDLGREQMPDTSDTSVSVRVRSVRRIITAYRSAARAQLLEEFPDLQQAINVRLGEARNQRVQGRAGTAREQLSAIADMADGQLQQ